MKKLIYILSFVLVFTTIANAGVIESNAAWMDSVIAEGVKKINKSITSIDDYTIVIDASKYFSTTSNPSYSVNFQENKWHYEVNGEGNSSFTDVGANANSIENNLNVFNSNRPDNVRLYSIFIKNIPFKINKKVAQFNSDTTLTFNQQLDNLIKKYPTDYKEMQAVFGLLINQIKQQSTHDAIIYAVGHFYGKYSKENKSTGFLCNYFAYKNTGPLANEERARSLKTIVNVQKRDYPIANVRGHIEAVLGIIEDNIKCSIDNNCGDLPFPTELAQLSFFNDPITNRTPRLETTIEIGSTKAELYDMSGTLNAQEEQTTLLGWINTCNATGINLKVFLTDANTNNNVIRQINEYKNVLPDKTVFLWIHEKADRKKYAAFNVSNDVCKNIDKAVLIQAYSDYFKQVQVTLDLPGKACEAIADWMQETIKVQPKYYDPQVIGYNPFMLQLYDALCAPNSCDELFNMISPKLGLVMGVGKQCHFAFMCGLWNGIVDQVQGVFELSALIGQSTKRTEFYNSMTALFNAPFSDTWNVIKQKFSESYLDVNNPALMAHNYGVVVINIAGCFIGLGEIKAVITTGKLTIELAQFAKLARVFTKGLQKGATGFIKLVKLGQYIIEYTVEAGKFIIKEIKNAANNTITLLDDFATHTIGYENNLLHVVTTDGQKLGLTYVDEVYDASNNKIGKFYEYGDGHEPVFVGNGKENTVKGTNQVGIWLNTLKANGDYKAFFDGLTNGTIQRKFADVLSIGEEAVLKFYTTNPGYKDLNRALRGEIPMTDFYTAQKNLMEQALVKLPNSAYNGPSNLLYRIENLTESQISSIYVEGSTFNANSFTSSTYSELAIIDAMRNRPYTVMIRIEGKNGKLIEDLSTLTAEKEILFKNGTQFKVIKIDKSANPADDYMSFIKTIWIKEL